MNKDTLPTAEEFLETRLRGDRVSDDIDKVLDEEDALEALIDFAKLHVEAALKEASEKAKTDKRCYYGTVLTQFNEPIVNKESILNSYPLENIQ